jgi:hypothetical protein
MDPVLLLRQHGEACLLFSLMPLLILAHELVELGVGGEGSVYVDIKLVFYFAFNPPPHRLR